MGASQVGVYEALHEAGIEPAWILGTSIGAINGALIAGNKPAYRMTQLLAFWKRLEQKSLHLSFDPLGIGNMVSNMAIMMKGLPAFFKPNSAAMLGNSAKLGVEHAACYCTEPLANAPLKLIDFEQINGAGETRLTVGAVNVTSGVIEHH